MNTKKTELECYVIVTGVKTRCRKVSREIIKLGNHPLSTTFNDVLTEIVVEKINQVMKRIDSATLHLDLVEIETIDGIDFKSWIMFDKRHAKRMLSIPHLELTD